MTLYGCDVSQYQEGLDLGSLVKQGYSFCWIRATIGLERDPQFLPFLWSAQCAGMLAAGYHFLLPHQAASLQAQAMLFAETLAGTPGILDVEPNGTDAPVPSYSDVLTFIHWFMAYGGNLRALYWPAWVWQLQRYPRLPTAYALISSNYEGAVAGETLAAQYRGESWDGWGAYGGLVPQLGQVTDRARVAGYGGPIDGDVFEGNSAQLMGIFGLEDDDMAKPRMVKTAGDPTVWATDGMSRWKLPDQQAMDDFVYNQHSRFGNPAMPSIPETVKDLASFGPVRADAA